MLKRILTTPFIVVVIVGGLTLQACSADSPSQPPTNDSTTSQPAPAGPTKTSFERDLQFIRNGQFTYVWLFSRPDGKPLDKDDASFLRQSAPQVVDWVTTDEGRGVIGGTNFDLEKGGMPELRKRFVVKDYTGR